MSDAQIRALVVTVAVASLLPWHLGSWSSPVRIATAAAAVLAWRGARPVLLIALLAILTTVQAGAAWSAIAAPVAEGPFAGTAVLMSDPVPTTGGVRARAEIEGRTYDLRAWGSSAGWLRNRLMGERVMVEASLRSLGDAPTWLRAQGIAGRGTVTTATAFSEGPVHTRVANSLRRTIESGARSMSRSERALFTGLVYGDDRQQSPLVSDNFAGAGLTHLLAVSGQNVAFVLAIGGPLLRRLGHRRRFAAVLGLLLVFATMTRFEPSVIRASVMTSIAATGALVGTSVPSKRVLLLAVAGLLIARPLLIHSVAFQLSVAASAGILLWSGRLARAIPGPRPLIDAVAVTASAQLAVAPLLLWRFDGLPVASLPANLLGGPAAGPIMMWGMTAGWLAGLVPAWVGVVIHMPTRLGLWWIDGVAQWTASQPFGEFAWSHLVVVSLAGWAGLRSQTTTARSAAGVVVCAALLAPGIGVGIAGPVAVSDLTGGSVLRQDHRASVVELDSSSRAEDVLAGLRRANVGHVDLIVARQSSFGMRDLIGWIDDRHGVGIVWAPTDTMGVGEAIPQRDAALRIGASICDVEIGEKRLGLRCEAPHNEFTDSG